MRSFKTLFLLGTVVLLLVAPNAVAPVAPSHAQGDTTPPAILEAAIGAVQAAIPGLGRPDAWRYEIALDVNTVGLGCPTASTDPLGRSVKVYLIWLTYGATDYLYYIAEDVSVIVPCDADLPSADIITLAGQRTPIGGANFATVTSIFSFTPAVADEVAYSPDGMVFAIAGQGVQLYSVPDYGLIIDLAPFLGPTEQRPTTIAFSADSRYLLLGTSSGAIWTYDMLTGNFVQVAFQFGHSVNVIEVDANNRVAVGTGGFDARELGPQIAVFDFTGFDPNTGTLPLLMQQFIVNVGVYDVAFVGETAVAAMGVSDLQVFEIATGSVLFETQTNRFGAPVVVAADDVLGRPGILSIVGVDDTATTGELVAWWPGEAAVIPYGSVVDLLNDLIVVPNQGTNTGYWIIAVETETGAGQLIASQQFLAYGVLPLNVVDMALSPDGAHLAVVVRGDVANTVEILAAP